MTNLNNNIPKWRKNLLNKDIHINSATTIDEEYIMGYEGKVKDVYQKNVGKIAVTYMVVGEKTINMNRSYSFYPTKKQS